MYALTGVNVVVPPPGLTDVNLALAPPAAVRTFVPPVVANSYLGPHEGVPKNPVLIVRGPAPLEASTEIRA
jgi:hypothetical protein